VLAFLQDHWVAIVVLLLLIDGIVWLVKKMDPFPQSVLDSKEGREAFVEAMVAPLRQRDRS
jgi:hypothetical protein